MRHLPGEQFHASHRIAENDDLLRGTGENYWGGIISQRIHGAGIYANMTGVY